MNKLSIFLVSMALLCLVSCHDAIKDNVARQSLCEGWTLTGDTLDVNIPVGVPSVVQTDLYEAGMIPHPYLGMVEPSLEWISDHPWHYSLTFDLDASLSQKERIDLVFEGIDTYATVTLNGEPVIHADNMFRTWSVPVSLRDSGNVLEVDFPSYDSIQSALYSQTSPKLPERYSVSRKAAYQHGWDWAPKYKNVGIWKPVSLVGWSDARIENASIVTKDIADDEASMSLSLDLLSSRPATRKVAVQLFCDDEKIIDDSVSIAADGVHADLPFTIDNPRLWWPNEMGEQPLYDFELRLTDADGLVETRTLRTGIKKVELICEPDSIGTGFYFKVNGNAMYAKGANYIPQDNFTSWMTRATDLDLLVDAKDAHFNMLRIWGGGIYPYDYFYDLCDSLGILVWQDFMFAGTMYPYDSAFLDNVRQEAVDQVKRLASHPSLAIWCGNNEVSEGYYNWGWQQQLGWTAEEDKAIKAGYDTLFEGILARVVAQCDGTRPYWPSSPSKGWGRAESLTEGDSHYWGVWWGEQPFEIYREKVSRFSSEYGYQAYPDIATLKMLCPDSVLYKDSRLIAAHQKHARGNQLIDDFIRRYYPYPSDFEDYVYVSQLSQAYGMGIAIEAHRTAKPYNMGTLFWQLNDSWPVVSWSSIDHYGRKKALQYKLGTLFAPVLLSLDENHRELHVVSDLMQPLNGQLEVKVMDFSGKMRYHESLKVTNGANENRAYAVPGLESILHTLPSDSVYVKLELMEDGGLVAERYCYLVLPKYLKLRPLKLDMDVNPVKDGWSITLKSDVLAKDVWLYTDSADGVFSDNAFDLEPGVTKTVLFKPKKYVESCSFKCRSLNALQ